MIPTPVVDIASSLGYDATGITHTYLSSYASSTYLPSLLIWMGRMDAPASLHGLQPSPTIPVN